MTDQPKPKPDRQNGDGLLPCPFCGSAPKILGSMHTIYCGADNCFGPATTADNLTDATVQWNTRATARPARDAAEGADSLDGLDERLDRLCLEASDGNRFILSTESARNIVGIVREWIRVKAAPPKPAPDAMRISDAQLAEGIKWIDWNDTLNIHDEMKQLRKAVERMFCLPLPSDCPPNLTEEICSIVDQCRSGHVIGAECAKAIYSAVAKYAALAAPVPPADGATAQDFWHELVEKTDRTSPEEYPDMALITFEELRDFITRALPSGAGAAEPVAWQHRIRPTVREKWSHWRDGKAAPTDWQFENRPLFATPPVKGDREAIARVICEADAFDYDEEKDLAERMSAQSAREIIDRAHRYADALIAAGLALRVQPGAGERETIDVPRFMETARSRWNFEETEFDAIENVISDPECVAALSRRQAPPSSSEGGR